MKRNTNSNKDNIALGIIASAVLPVLILIIGLLNITEWNNAYIFTILITIGVSVGVLLKRDLFRKVQIFFVSMSVIVGLLLLAGMGYLYYMVQYKIDTPGNRQTLLKSIEQAETEEQKQSRQNLYNQVRSESENTKDILLKSIAINTTGVIVNGSIVYFLLQPKVKKRFQ